MKVIILDAGGVLIIRVEDRGVLNPDVVALLDEYRDRYRFAVLSDTDLPLADTLVRFGISDRFEHVMTSGQEGTGKEKPEIFLHAAQRLGVTPEECMLIDDTPEFCAAAEVTGMRSILYRSGMDLAQAVELVERSR